MIKVNVLRANHGDAIHIQYVHEAINRNILIDSGTGATYFSLQHGRVEDGELKNLIKDLFSRNESIDLLIITHWDDDHIGGVLKWFDTELECAKSMIKHIWFNSGTLINNYFDTNLASEDKTIISSADYNPNTSIRQGISFEKLILDNGISHELVKNDSCNDIIYLNGAKFIILSPTDRELEKLLRIWSESDYNPNTSLSNDYDKTLQELLSNEFFEDDAIHNGSSIAFILQIENKTMLFLGDAHPGIIVNSLRNLRYSENNKLEIDLMKVSHHGSKANTSDELLDLIQCDHFIISTDGSRHRLPNKEAIARIVAKQANCKIYFNFPEIIQGIFSTAELNNGQFEALDTTGLTL